MPAPVSDANTVFLYQFDESHATDTAADTGPHANNLGPDGGIPFASVTGFYGGARGHNTEVVGSMNVTNVPVVVAACNFNETFNFQFLIKGDPTALGSTPGIICEISDASGGVTSLVTLLVALLPDGHIRVRYQGSDSATHDFDQTSAVKVNPTTFTAVAIEKYYVSSVAHLRFSFNGNAPSDTFTPAVDVINFAGNGSSTVLFFGGSGGLWPLYGSVLDAAWLRTGALSDADKQAYAGSLYVLMGGVAAALKDGSLFAAGPGPQTRIYRF